MLASAPRRIGSSAIRDLLAITERPEVLSLAGGLPAPETFPVERLAEAAAAVARDEPASLQYGPSQGHAGLRAVVADRLGVPADAVVLTHGSQQAIELLARCLVDPGTPVVTGDPCYIGALQAFRLAGADLRPVPVDEHGLRVDVLAERLDAGEAPPAFVYTVATVDNPTGSSLSPDRAAHLARLADRHGFWIVDDDPYGELRWTATAGAPLRSSSDRVITLGTTSKILSPGLRVGWAVAPPELVAALVLLKQAVDLQTTSFTQAVAHRLLAEPGFLDHHLVGVRARYRAGCTALADALRRRFGSRIRFTEPGGGLFLWARLPGVDTRRLLDRALARDVAFVPGREFAVDVGALDALRLSYATVAPADLGEAVDRLAGALDDLADDGDRTGAGDLATEPA